MSRSTQATTSTGTRSSLARRVFGVGFRRETYANLAYLLVRFPLGVGYLVTLVFGLSIGLGLLPVIIGVPILAGVLALAGYVGVVEAALLRRFRGATVRHDPPTFGDHSVVRSLRTAVTTPRNYLFVAFALSSFAVGTALFVALTTTFTLALALVLAPVLYRIPGVSYDLTHASGPLTFGPVSVDIGAIAGASIDTLPEALVASLLGVVVVVVGLHAVNLTARLVAGVTRRLLHARPA